MILGRQFAETHAQGGRARAYAACTYRKLGAAPSPRELWLKTVWNLGGLAMRTTTIKATSLRIFAALLVLGMLRFAGVSR